MSFKGVTFAGQNVTPKNDGGLYASHHGDGILWGCSMAISGDDLIVQSGELIIGGRVVHVDGATNIDLSTRGGSPYIQVRVYADLSQPEGSQWDTTFIESSSLVFTPSLVQDDINYNGTKYEAELCVLQDAGGVLSIYRTMQYSPLSAKDQLWIDDGSSNWLRGKIDSSGGGFNYKPSGGIEQGIYFPKSGASDVIIYGNGDSVFVRPNGVSNDTGRATFYANGDFRIGGQMLGGTTTLTGNALVSSVTGNTVVAKVDSGLDATARYIVFGYFGGTPSNSNAGSTDMAIDVDGSAYRVQSIFSNSSVTKYQTMDAWVIGATSKIELRVWTSSQYNWNNIVAQLQVVRIA